MTELRGERVLVTGGAGFTGSSTVALLLAEGATVTVLDNLFTGFEALIPSHERVTFVRGDVCDAALVEDLVAQHPLVIHAAAKNIIVSTRNPREDCETNVLGTLNVLMAAAKRGARKVVYTGSASVYGNPTTFPIVETSGLYALSPYAASKLAGENYCTAFYESYGLPVCVLRYSNVYGTNQSPDNPYCGVIAKFFAWALEGKPIRIHGDGDQTRDFTFVADAARATVEALASARSTGQVFNVATGTETSINSLAARIAAICGRPDLEIEHVDKRDIDNIRRRVLNIEGIRRILRWTPEYTLQRGLEATHRWLLGSGAPGSLGRR